MKKVLKKLTSLVLAFVMTFTISVQGFAETSNEAHASPVAKSQDSYNSNVYKQRLKQLEIVKANLKNVPGVNAKINHENIVEIYTDEVTKINKKAVASGGLVYGKWFGGYDSEYEMSPSETIRLVGALTSAFIPFLNSEKIAVKAATAISSAIGWTLTVKPGQWLKVNRRKSYREVKYSDGTFAYWQTKVGASVTRDNSYLGDGETIISGGMW